MDEQQKAKRHTSVNSSIPLEQNYQENTEQLQKSCTNGEPQTPQQDPATRVAASPAESTSSRHSHAPPTVTRNLLGGDLVLSKSNVWTLVHDPVRQVIFVDGRFQF